MCHSAPSSAPPPFQTYPTHPNAPYPNYPNVPRYPPDPNANSPTYRPSPYSNYSYTSNPYPPGPTFGPTNNHERRRLAKLKAQAAADRRRQGENEFQPLDVKLGIGPYIRYSESRVNGPRKLLTMQREQQQQQLSMQREYTCAAPAAAADD